MSTKAEPVLDAEVVTEFRSLLSVYVDGRLKDERAATERLIKERTARGVPAFGGAPSTTDARPMLGGDARFRDWVKSPGGKSRGFTAAYPFHIEQKATTITSPALPTMMPGIFGPQQPSLRLTELLPTLTLAAGGSVEYARETGFTPGADIVPETTVKPYTSIDFLPAQCLIKTIATIVKVTLQALSDTPGLSTWLDSRLTFAVQLRAEEFLLNAAAPDGIMASAGAMAPEFAPGTGATALDVIGAAIAQLQAAGYSPNGVVMSGSDVNKMRLLKDSQGRYLWSSPNGAVDTAAVWQTPLVISPSMPAGSWLVGAFGQSTILFSRQQLVIDVAYENEDDFIRNLACLRCEERIGLSIPVPQGLLKGTFTAGVEMAKRK